MDQKCSLSPFIVPSTEGLLLFTYFLRFLARSSVLLFALNGIAALLILTCLLCFTFSQQRFAPAVMPFLMLSWSAILHVSPLIIFLPADGFGNVRYLFWFLYATFVAAVLFCVESPLMRSHIRRTINYWTLVLRNSAKTK